MFFLILGPFYPILSHLPSDNCSNNCQMFPTTISFFFFRKMHLSYILIIFLLISLSNNVKFIQASEKKLKLFQYFRKLNNRLSFSKKHTLRQMSKHTDRQPSRTNVFSHSKTNSCRAVIGYYGQKSFKLLKKFNDKL